MASQLKSTYARLFIGFSPAFSKWVVETSKQSPHKTSSILPITILGSDQVFQAFADPQNQSLHKFVGTAYADSIRTDRVLIATLEETESQAIFIEETVQALSSKRKRSPEALKENIALVTNSLTSQSKLLKNIHESASHALSQLLSLPERITDQITSYQNAWRAYREKNLDRLNVSVNELLKKFKLPELPQGEIDNLKRQDTWQDLLDRFVDLGASRDFPEAELEKILQIKNPSLATYFKLKAYLAIRSVSPTRERMAEYMSQLKSDFDEMERDGANLTDHQTREVDQFDITEVKPLLQKATDNHSTLGQLDADRTQILKAVASTEELITISEKTQARMAVATTTRPSQS